jgi:hypothetical protein
MLHQSSSSLSWPRERVVSKDNNKQSRAHGKCELMRITVSVEERKTFIPVGSLWSKKYSKEINLLDEIMMRKH